ncbi:hypothetical protein ACEWX3_00245 [Mycobacterium sp. G7A2]|uniref:hypothetical protein n=1 Tax=Mycobacterium sp. G7A2 TaxID=3317307 RepID=UPI0035A8CC28
MQLAGLQYGQQVCQELRLVANGAAGVKDVPSVADLEREYRYAAAWCLYIGWLTTPLENYGWEINVANHIRLATAYRDLDSRTVLAAL